MESYATMLEAINQLKTKGYTLDFNLQPNALECKSLNTKIQPCDFIIDEFHRFEGASNPDDNSIVYAISSNSGLKGLLVDAYGVYADALTEEMVQKLQIRR